MRPSLRSQALRLALRVLVRRRLAARRHDSRALIAEMRRTFEAAERRYRDVPADVRIVPVTTSDVRGEWVIRRDVAVGERVLLYVHGGAMVACRPLGYRSITVPLARRLGVPVFVVDYRHAPEHPYPAALDDTLAAYRALRARIPAGGILVAGDSAGGNLALAALLALRERTGESRPVAGVVALSPWTDLVATGASLAVNARSEDVLVAAADGGGPAAAYADRARWRDPLVSPLYGDYRGGPPLLVFASTTEMLLDDARALVARVRAQGGIATLVQEPRMPHAWPIFGALPEAVAAHVTIADFARRAWTA